jgi:hypothetical protein
MEVTGGSNTVTTSGSNTIATFKENGVLKFSGGPPVASNTKIVKNVIFL